jgi:HD-GYP domain-containing protein (c-di-GMP phosphodiesterase class II)
MSEERATKLQGTRLLHAASQRGDQSPARVIGPQLITSLLRIIRVAEMFAVSHAQTAQAAEELALWLASQCMGLQVDALTLLITDTNLFLNGMPIRLDEQSYARSVTLRATILSSGFNQLRLIDGLNSVELIAFLTALRAGADALHALALPHLKLGVESQLPAAASDAAQDERREVLALYSTAIIKCASYFEQLRTDPTASARYVKRAMQQLTDRFAQHRYVFIGLINMRLVPPQDFVHAVHTALYAMFIANELGFDRADVVRVGMTAITQDIHRITHPNAPTLPPTVGEAEHFNTNMASVSTLSQIGVSDVLSALRLVTGYERGFSHLKHLPPAWYKEERRPHLLTRIIELAKHYDLFVQGLDDTPGLSPDMALQTIMMQAGIHYDPDLARLFINILGIYPVGSQVTLSTDERALVVRSPAIGQSQTARAIAHRPVVRLHTTGRLLDLSSDEHRAIRIVALLNPQDALETHPGAFAFF